MRSTSSAFAALWSSSAGSPLDRTGITLPDTRDRILAPVLTATWLYDDEPADYDATWQGVRDVLASVFAAHESRSAQHTVYAMGEEVLRRFPRVREMSIAWANKHNLLVDLSPFGLENHNEVFLPIDEPHGLIEATMPGGIFLDQAPTSPFCLGPVALAIRVARRAGLTTVVLNPGVPTDPLYRDLGVPICTFEGSWLEYRRWSGEGSLPGDGHLVHSVPAESLVEAETQLRERYAGWGLVTDRTPPHPYAGLPSWLPVLAAAHC